MSKFVVLLLMALFAVANVQPYSIYGYEPFNRTILDTPHDLPKNLRASSDNIANELFQSFVDLFLQQEQFMRTKNVTYLDKSEISDYIVDDFKYWACTSMYAAWDKEKTINDYFPITMLRLVKRPVFLRSHWINDSADIKMQFHFFNFIEEANSDSQWALEFVAVYRNNKYYLKKMDQIFCDGNYE